LLFIIYLNPTVSILLLTPIVAIHMYSLLMCNDKMVVRRYIGRWLIYRDDGAVVLGKKVPEYKEFEGEESSLDIDFSNVRRVEIRNEVHAEDKGLNARMACLALVILTFAIKIAFLCLYLTPYMRLFLAGARGL